MTQVFLWETKTTSEDISLGSSFWKRTAMDVQLSLYLPALRAMGHDPRGAIYDALRKPKLSPSGVPLLDDDGTKIVVDQNGQRVRTKDGKKWRQSGDAELGYKLQTRPETPEEYGQRCLDAIAEKSDYYYARGLVVRLEADEKEAAADVWQTASQMRESKRLSIYPRNPDSCVQWSRDCDYLGVCSGIADINDPLFFKQEAANVELDGADDLSLLSQSAMRCYRSCQRKYYFRYVIRQRPLKKATTLSTGSSIHAALDVFRRTGGDFDAALKALMTEDLYVRAMEGAMLAGYVARWGKPTGIVAVEQMFKIPLINPETGAASRTFTLGGQVDAIVSAEAAQDLMNPVPPMTPEEQLRLSVEENES